MDFDLIVVGSGPGGYHAAIRGAQLDLKVAVVEKDPKLGGTCLHRGCIPTKALLHTASTLDEIREAGSLGITVGEPTLDVPKAQERKRKVVDSNARGIEGLFKKNKVTWLRGLGRMAGPNEVAVEAFMAGKIRFGRIPDVVGGTIDRHRVQTRPSLDDLLEADRWARSAAESLVAG